MRDVNVEFWATSLTHDAEDLKVGYDALAPNRTLTEDERVDLRITINKTLADIARLQEEVENFKKLTKTQKKRFWTR